MDGLIFAYLCVEGKSLSLLRSHFYPMHILPCHWVIVDSQQYQHSARQLLQTDIGYKPNFKTTFLPFATLLVDKLAN